MPSMDDGSMMCVWGEGACFSPIFFFVSGWGARSAISSVSMVFAV